MEQEPKICDGIILSDVAIREAGTGKLSLIGCFANWNASSFPFPINPFFVTFLLTNIQGAPEQMHVTARIEDPQTGHVLTSVSGAMKSVGGGTQNRSDVTEIALPMPPFFVQSAGRYQLKILINNEPVGLRTVCVRALTAGNVSAGD